MIGPVFARALPAGERTEVDTTCDVQLVNIALATHKAGRTTIKLHYTSYEFDEESSSDEEEDEEEEEDSSDEMEAELKPKVNGDTSKGEDVTVVVASLTPDKVEFATINVFLPAAEVFEFIVEGPNDVHIMGNEVFQESDMHDDYPYDSYDSDLYDSEIDSELEDEEGGIYDPETGLPIEYDSDDLLDGESDEEDSEVDSDRFAEVQEESAALPKINGHANGADLPSEDDDDEMDADEKSTEIDMSKLSKSQRKKLAKKLKAEAAGKADIKSVVGKKEETVTISKDGKKTDQVKTTAQVTVNGANGKDVKATAKKASKKTTLPNGTQIEDIKVGDGAAAKPGQKVSLRYIGKLQDGKVFDSNTKGKPFSFKLGKSEVIKGWDSGIEGMRPGGERRLTIPPSAAYGKQGTEGIPPNSVLKFEVKLLSIA